MTKRTLGFTVALALFFLSSAAWSQIDLGTDPLWRALTRAAPGVDAPPPAEPAKSLGGRPGLKASCKISANCGGGTPVSCKGTTTCTGADQDCSANPIQQGYVDCGSGVAYCPDPCITGPPPEDCTPYSFPGCTYSFNPATNCCEAYNESFICPFACF
jgi:hypothetical protein